MLRCVPDQTQTIEARHAEIMRALGQIPPPWGLGAQDAPPAPQTKQELIAECRLDHFLGSGVRGSLVYRYRKGLADAGMYDDFLRLEFDPARAQYKPLVQSVIPELINGLGPYRVELGPEELTLLDFDAMRRGDSRTDVHRFYPVTYLGRALCRRALSIEPKDVMDRLGGLCEKATILNEGALLVATQEPVDVDGSEAINKSMWSGLRATVTVRDAS